MWSGTGKEERAVAVIEEGTAATLSRSSRLVVVEHSGSVAAPLVWSLIVQLSNLIPRAQFILNLWRFCLICLTYCNKKQHLITSLRWIVLSVNFLQLLLLIAYMSFLCFFFGLFFSLAFLPGILRKTSKKSLSDCLLLHSHSDCRNAFTHIMMMMMMMMKCFVAD